MAKEKMVEQITSMDVDFAQWYTDVVKKAELADYEMRVLYLGKEYMVSLPLGEEATYEIE